MEFSRYFDQWSIDAFHFVNKKNGYTDTEMTLISNWVQKVGSKLFLGEHFCKQERGKMKQDGMLREVEVQSWSRAFSPVGARSEPGSDFGWSAEWVTSCCIKSIWGWLANLPSQSPTACLLHLVWHLEVEWHTNVACVWVRGHACECFDKRVWVIA